MTRFLFPLWQIDLQEYHAICGYLGITPKARLYDRLSEYLANAPFRFPRPTGFSLFLAKLPVTRFTIARADLITKVFLPDHPMRHALNGVIALHECDGEGFAEMAVSPTGWAALASIFRMSFGFIIRLAITLPWLAWQFARYALGIPFRRDGNLSGKRVLITGVNRGLGLDLMLACLERGAALVGTVRSREALEGLRAELPPEAPITFLMADLAKPGALVEALRQAQIEADSINMALLCAGVKHDGESVLALPKLRETFEVNCFSAAEFAAWLCAPHKSRSGSIANRSAEPARDSNSTNAEPRHAREGNGRSKCALVIISSIGRWHGMHGSCGYNASKAALSIWGESLDMELRQSGDQRIAVTVVEPGMFEAGMTKQTRLTKLLFVSRRDVAERVISGAQAGRRSIRPPFWFALLTWGVCLAGRDVRYRLFARVKPSGDD